MEEEITLTINKEYAEKYVKKKQAEELSRRKHHLEISLQAS